MTGQTIRTTTNNPDNSKQTIIYEINHRISQHAPDDVENNTREIINLLTAISHKLTDEEIEAVESDLKALGLEAARLRSRQPNRYLKIRGHIIRCLNRAAEQRIGGTY